MYVDQLVKDAVKLAEMSAVGLFIAAQASFAFGVLWFFTA